VSRGYSGGSGEMFGGMDSHIGVAKWDCVVYSNAHEAIGMAPIVVLGEGGKVRQGMFLGDHQHTLDSKGRVSLPARFRMAMTGKLVVAKGLDRCLYVYPADEYVRFVEELIKREDFEPRVRKIRRFFTAGAVEVELDAAGRVSLPASLRTYAGLSKDVAIAGNGNRIEIWDSEVWSHYNESGESIEDLARELADAGLL